VNKKRINFSFASATIGTLFFVIFKKIGGHLSGGIYSDSHSWIELFDNVHEFVICFIVVYVFSYVLFYRE